MARYKVLKSVAHSVVHSFTSDLNYGEGDYVMCHLLKAMIDSGVTSLRANLLTGAAEPRELLRSSVRSSIAQYVKWLPDLVTSHKTSMEFVRAAEIVITFDLSVHRPMAVAPESTEYPFVGIGRITDDRGKTWEARVSDWWSPDAGTPVRVPRTDFVPERYSFRGWLRSIWR